MDELRRMAPNAGFGLTEQTANDGTTIARESAEDGTTALSVWIVDESGSPVLVNVLLEPRYSSTGVTV
jgi:hypothetical protein